MMKINTEKLVMLTLFCVLITAASLIGGCTRTPEERLTKRPVVRQPTKPRPSPIVTYGICAHSLTEKDAKAMNSLGINMLRTDFVWERIEPSKGRWNFDYYDELVDRAKKYNISLLGILNYSANWASSAPTSANKRYLYPPKNVDDYANFVAKTVERYKDDITYWEIWNEPNIQNFWRPKPSASEYTKLLKEAYKAAKKVNPDSKVLLGGVGEIDLEFIRQVYENGGKDFFDMMAVHPYRQPRSPYSYPSLSYELGQLRKLMEKYSDHKDIWFTEIGWHTKGRRSVNPRVQALYLKETFGIVRNINVNSDGFVGAVFWYELRDGGTNKSDPEDNFGLLQHDYKPKPAFYVYNEVTNQKIKSNETQ